ncbi:hypothetical protein V8D89_005661 [Ganoderma adspersum]
MLLPHMSTAGAAWMGLLGTSLSTRSVSEVPTHHPFSTASSFLPSFLLPSLWPVQYLNVASHGKADPPSPPALHKVSAAPSVVSPPRGCRRSRASHSGSHLRRESLHCGGEEVDEPTHFQYSRLSGTGGSDCAEWARRIARLSLRLRAPRS